MTANTYRDLTVELEKNDGRKLTPEKTIIALGEALGAVCMAVGDEDLKAARKRFVQIAAVAVQAVESLDQRMATAAAKAVVAVKAVEPVGDVKPKVAAKASVKDAGKPDATLV